MIAVRKVDHQSLDEAIAALLEELRFTPDKTIFPPLKDAHLLLKKLFISLSSPEYQIVYLFSFTPSIHFLYTIPLFF